MKVSDYIHIEKIIRDGEFHFLGNADSSFLGTLCFADSIHYVELANKNINISGIIVQEELVSVVDPIKSLIVTENPRHLFYEVHESLRVNKKYKVVFEFGFGRGENVNIHPTAFVSEKSWIGDNTYIGPNVSILDDVYIGKNCFIEAGATIGGEGILYNKIAGNNKVIRHAGGVKIDNEVTVLSNAAIMKSIYPHVLTTVGDHSIIGVSSIVGHESIVGKNCVVSGNSLIARGVILEDKVWIGSSAVLREYVRIGAEAKVKAGSIVVKNVKAKQEVSGNFAVEHRNHLRSFFKMEKGLDS